MRYPKQPEEPFSPAPSDMKEYLETMEAFILQTSKHLKQLEIYIKFHLNDKGKNDITEAKRREDEKNDFLKMISDVNQRFDITDD